jgi:hypothetical protein
MSNAQDKWDAGERDYKAERDTPAQSWKAEVLVDSNGHYTSNALRFATQSEAGSYAIDLFHRWATVRNWRTVATSDPVTYAWAGRLIPLKPGDVA